MTTRSGRSIPYKSDRARTQRPDGDLMDLEMFRIRGRTALVTGAAGLLGQKHLEILAEAGANIVAADVTEAVAGVALRIGKEYGVDTMPVVVDIAEKDQVTAAFGAARERFGGLDILVNNAGMTVKGAGDEAQAYFAPFEDYPLHIWERAIRTNVTGTFLCCQAAGRIMRERGQGVILNIASVAASSAPDQRIYRGVEPPYGLAAFNNPPSYMTSKAAIVGLTKWLATYWGEHGIRVNSLSPGGVYHHHSDQFVRNYSNRVPLGRMAREDEYKGAVLFLVSDASTYMTGQDVIADGGLSVW